MTVTDNEKETPTESLPGVILSAVIFALLVCVCLAFDDGEMRAIRVAWFGF